MDKIVYSGLTFTDDEIVAGEVYRPASLLYDAIEVGTITVDVYTQNQEVVRRLLQFRRNEKLLHYHGDMLQGTYYIESVDRTGKYTVTITANDAVSLLEQSNHFGGIYTGQTVAEIVADICNIPQFVQSRFQKVKLYGWLPIATRRDNLSQVLFAIGACAKVDQNGALRIEALWDGVSQKIGEDRIFWGESVKYESEVSDVSVTEHQYVPSQEEIVLFEGSAFDGDVVEFQEPSHSLAASGFTIIESGANHAVLSAGSGKLTGKKYSHTTKIVKRHVSDTEIANTVEIKDATLVSLINSSQIADRLSEYYKTAETITHDVIYNEEHPGSVVSFPHPYGGEAVGTIKNSTISFGHKLRSTETVAVGYSPRYDNQSVVYDKSEILTGAGTWTPPDGVTEVRAVLIGGGGPGGNGGSSAWVSSNGDGDSNTTVVRLQYAGETETVSRSADAKTLAASQADGGAGGIAGIPGNVLDISVEIQPGVPISYACGAAGSEAGRAGSDTTFGDATSADGGILPAGYTDVASGITYAKPGVAGVAGGRGGSPGSAGQSVAGVSGGAGSQSVGDSDNYKVSTTVFNGKISASGTTTGSGTAGGAGGGGAGGGTEDNPGEAGKNASAANVSISTGTNLAGVTVSPSYPGAGGKGANGKNAQTYGSAGDGGHGGGGHGGIAASSASASVNVTYKVLESIGSIANIEAGPSCTIDSRSRSTSNGGIGGSGMEGCIILYYGAPKTEISGPVKERAGKVMLDRLGRLKIV